MKSVLRYITGAIIIGTVYLFLWPVPIDPIAWTAPNSRGYVGKFEKNSRLLGLIFIDLKGETGPEDAAIGPDGLVYLPTHTGKILTIDLNSKKVAEFAKPGGRVLGIEFSDTGELYAADAFRGLLKISPAGDVTVLTNRTSNNKTPIHYANDLDIAHNGTVFFSDASTKFGARANGGTLPASLLDLMEHGPNGRVLKYDPQSRKTTTVIEGLSFANGVALAADDSFLLVSETGTYRVLKHWLKGRDAGKTETILENLPGFPDNINTNPDGTFWLGLVSPRSAVVDRISAYPVLRKIVMRLPAVLRPKPQRYGFAMKFNGKGDILDVLQDPAGNYALVTGGIDVGDGRVIITSLTEPRLGYLGKQ